MIPMKEQIGVKIINKLNSATTIKQFTLYLNLTNNLFTQQTRDQFSSLMNFIHIYNMKWPLGVK